MNLNELIVTLDRHLRSPQPSERWAMYRLIAPVVDYANQSLGFLPYFEFNQASTHGTHQSVDIALLDNQKEPRVLIEAKRAGRKVSPEQIDKYLNNSTRGVVTNGFIWVLCHEGKHESISLYDSQLNLESLNRILGFIAGSVAIAGKVNSPDHVYNSPIKPEKIINKAGHVTRSRHPVTTCSNHDELLKFISSAENRPECEFALLRAISHALESDGATKSLRFETRKTRVSIFNNLLNRRDSRLARIELGKTQPDLLVRTWIVDKHPELASIAKPNMHEKGPHMRRFRLSSEDQATAFGFSLVEALNTCFAGSRRP